MLLFIIQYLFIALLTEHLYMFVMMVDRQPDPSFPVIQLDVVPIVAYVELDGFQY